MKNKNKKIAAGTLLCALTSTGLTGVQASADRESGITKAVKECTSDIVITGLAMTGGAYLVDRISDEIPSTAKKVIGELGSIAAKPLKWLGEKVVNKISEMPTLFLLGGIAMIGYSIKKISEKYIENRVKEEVEKKTNNKNNGNTNDITIYTKKIQKLNLRKK